MPAPDGPTLAHAAPPTVVARGPSPDTMLRAQIPQLWSVNATRRTDEPSGTARRKDVPNPSGMRFKAMSIEGHALWRQLRATDSSQGALVPEPVSVTCS